MRLFPAIAIFSLLPVTHLAGETEAPAHWVYRPLPVFKAPAPGFTSDPESPVDAFFWERLHVLGLSPPPEADPVTLMRRLFFDLSSLPPTFEDIDSFAVAHTDGNFANIVDRLLDSPRVAGRMAMPWLDLVRYADSVGYHADQEHQIPPLPRLRHSGLQPKHPFRPVPPGATCGRSS